MSHSSITEVDSRYLRLEIDGEWTVENARDGFEFARAEAQRLGQTRLLFDVRQLIPPRFELVRYRTGELMAEIFGARFKLAFLGRAEGITRFAETVAVNRGARVCVFADEKDAVAWLLEEPARPTLPSARPTPPSA